MRRAKVIYGALLTSLKHSGSWYGVGPYAEAVYAVNIRPHSQVFGYLPDRRYTSGYGRTRVDYSRMVPVFREGGQAVSYNAVWLRENCRCDACFRHATWQRSVVFHRLPPEAFIASHVTWESQESVVEVIWGDRHLSRYPVTWLDSTTHPKQLYYNPATVSRVYWDADLELDSLPPVEYTQLLEEQTTSGNPVKSGDDTESEAGEQRPVLRRLLNNLLCYGFVFIDNTPANLEGTIAATNVISFPQTTLFGENWEFGASSDDDDDTDLHYTDTAYTTDAIGLHNDGTYFTQPPGIQALHLLRHEGGGGGETLLADGYRAAHLLREHDPASFKLLSTTRIEHHYIDHTRRHNYRSHDTMIRIDPHSGNPEWIRYNPYDRSPMPTVENLQGPTYKALATLGILLEDPTAVLKFKLRPGRLLLVDNWRVLHGRTGFTGRRELCGCYLPRDDWLNKARQMALI